MRKFTDILKKAKVKVTKDGCAGYYIYHGMNFTVKFNLEECETFWWEINILEDNIDKRVENRWDYNGLGCENSYETKSELVWDLFTFDKSLNN